MNATVTPRNQVFVSHANPEDNEFARWLSLRLTCDGYLTWCDQTKLLGGEVFWMDIEESIRYRTAKFVFILSHYSNVKEGARKELALAETTLKTLDDRDFIIPVRIDDIPHCDMNIEIHRRNAIDFRASWAEGYAQLLKKLDSESVPKAAPHGSDSVSEWWRKQFDAETGLRPAQEEHLSNWFPISSLPPFIFRHRVRLPVGYVTPPFSAVFVGKQYFSFASLSDLGLHKSAHAKSLRIPLKEFVEGKMESDAISRNDARRVVVQLLNDAWNRFLDSTKLPTYQFSAMGKAVYFPHGRLEGDKISFEGVDGKTFRQVCGIAKESFWHFAVRGRSILSPFPAIEVKNHVLFSDDGTNIWESKERLHRKRRSHCRNWWNDEWRDRLLATMSWFSQHSGEIVIPIARLKSIVVSSKPVSFFSSVAYSDPPPSTFSVVEDGSGLQYDEEEEE